MQCISIFLFHNNFTNHLHSYLFLFSTIFDKAQNQAYAFILIAIVCEELIMQGDKKVIDYLNKALKNELTAINQYFLHARMYKNWGFEKLNDYEYHESIDEMKHADWLIERILFLEGLPNLQDLDRLLIGENPKEMLECDLKMEQQAIPVLKEAIAYCETVADYISRELFEKILDNEEEHIDWLEAQFERIEQVGLQNYLQSMM